MNELRKCKACGSQRELTDFYSFISGGKWKCYSSDCKQCAKVRYAERRKQKGDEIRAYDRKRSREKLSTKCIECGVVRTPDIKWGIHSAHPDKYGKKSLCVACFDARKRKTKENLKRIKKLSDQRCRERVNRQNRKWRMLNREKNRIYHRQWSANKRAKNPELARQKESKWRENNKDKVKASFKKWVSANYDKVIHRNRCRRALKRGACVVGSELVTNEWFKELCSKHGNRCYYCWDAEKKLGADHIIPLINGGKHVRENIIPACKPCNSRKSKKPIAEWRPWIDIPLYGLDLASA